MWGRFGSKERQLRPPSECSVCGAAVPLKARACPECGADDRTGWNDETTRYDGLDLSAEAFNSDDNREGLEHEGKSVGIFWWVVGVGMLGVVGVLVFIGRF